ncbi:MAG: hypothetical protein ACI8TE_000045 [Francisella sp.]|jgi:hypothetical protein
MVFKKDNLWLKSLMSWALEGKEPMNNNSDGAEIQLEKDSMR